MAGISNFIQNLFTAKKYRVRFKKFKKPLYRINGKIYWKGYSVDDDLFSELMNSSPREVMLYNRAVSRADRKIKNRRRNKRKRYY